MIAIAILYLLCLIPAIIFTRFGIKEGIMGKRKMSKILFFLSVWIVTPGFFIVYLMIIIRRKLSH